MINLLLEKVIKKKKIKGFRKTLLIGDPSVHGRSDECRKLAKKISSYGINVLLTGETWPRDRTHVFEDGTLLNVDVGLNHDDLYNHEIFHGGKFLVGNSFLLGSESMYPEKREKTLELLGLEKAIYIHMNPCYSLFEDLNIGGKKFYLKTGLMHIDTIFNLTNKNPCIFTYSHRLLTDAAKTVAEQVGYKTREIPIEEVEYAAVGFIELGDHVVVDKRAKGTIRVMKELGYEIITTPKPMKFTNKNRGSIRCRTKEIPDIFERLQFNDPQDYYENKKNLRDSFFTLDGRTVKKEGSYRKKLVLD